MKTVEQILDAKGRDVWSVSSDATVYSALELMARKNVGAVLVLDQGEPVGMLSERDYARKVVLEDRTSHDTPVRDIMTPDPVCIRPDQTIEDCMALMTNKRFRHLPVLDGDDLVGLLSIGDVVKAIISEREYVIEQLETYISGH